jgi:hypothetical protein
VHDGFGVLPRRALNLSTVSSARGLSNSEPKKTVRLARGVRKRSARSAPRTTHVVVQVGQARVEVGADADRDALSVVLEVLTALLHRHNRCSPDFLGGSSGRLGCARRESRGRSMAHTARLVACDLAGGAAKSHTEGVIAGWLRVC